MNESEEKCALTMHHGFQNYIYLSPIIISHFLILFQSLCTTLLSFLMDFEVNIDINDVTIKEHILICERQYKIHNFIIIKF